MGYWRIGSLSRATGLRGLPLLLTPCCTPRCTPSRKAPITPRLPMSWSLTRRRRRFGTTSQRGSRRNGSFTLDRGLRQKALSHAVIDGGGGLSGRGGWSTGPPDDRGSRPISEVRSEVRIALAADANPHVCLRCAVGLGGRADRGAPGGPVGVCAGGLPFPDFPDDGVVPLTRISG